MLVHYMEHCEWSFTRFGIGASAWLSRHEYFNFWLDRTNKLGNKAPWFNKPFPLLVFGFLLGCPFQVCFHSRYVSISFPAAQVLTHPQHVSIAQSSPMRREIELCRTELAKLDKNLLPLEVCVEKLICFMIHGSI